MGRAVGITEDERFYVEMFEIELERMKWENSIEIGKIMVSYIIKIENLSTSQGKNTDDHQILRIPLT
jgi:hypothetical protein